MFFGRQSFKKFIGFNDDEKRMIRRTSHPSNSTSIYPVVRLIISAMDLPNLEMLGTSDPFFQIFGFDLKGNCQLLYTSEVISGTVDYVRWKEAIFGLSKSTIFSKFRVSILDKEMIGEDRALVDQGRDNALQCVKNTGDI